MLTSERSKIDFIKTKNINFMKNQKNRFKKNQKSIFKKNVRECYIKRVTYIICIFNALKKKGISPDSAPLVTNVSSCVQL